MPSEARSIDLESEESIVQHANGQVRSLSEPPLQPSFSTRSDGQAAGSSCIVTGHDRPLPRALFALRLAYVVCAFSRLRIHDPKAIWAFCAQMLQVATVAPQLHSAVRLQSTGNVYRNLRFQASEIMHSCIVCTFTVRIDSCAAPEGETVRSQPSREAARLRSHWQAQEQSHECISHKQPTQWSAPNFRAPDISCKRLVLGGCDWETARKFNLLRGCDQTTKKYSQPASGKIGLCWGW